MAKGSMEDKKRMRGRGRCEKTRRKIYSLGEKGKIN